MCFFQLSNPLVIHFLPMRALKPYMAESRHPIGTNASKEDQGCSLGVCFWLWGLHRGKKGGGKDQVATPSLCLLTVTTQCDFSPLCSCFSPSTPRMLNRTSQVLDKSPSSSLSMLRGKCSFVCYFEKQQPQWWSQWTHYYRPLYPFLLHLSHSILGCSRGIQFSGYLASGYVRRGEREKRIVF